MYSPRLGVLRISKQSKPYIYQPMMCFKPIRLNSTLQGPAKTSQSAPTKSNPASRNAFIALGSNMGNRLETIESACRKLDLTPTTKVIRTSGLWDTEPMYVKNQDRFLNGVCEVETSLAPIDLLDQLQKIEDDLGRVKIIDKGPRTVDLDILLYGDEKVDLERLTVPHKLMLERDFVLRPLCELIPEQTLPGAPVGETFAAHLDALDENFASVPEQKSPVAVSLDPLKKGNDGIHPPATSSTKENALPKPPPTSPLTFFNNSIPPLTASLPTRKTRIMTILNLTPDSFSDGGTHPPTETAHLHTTISTLFTQGADILDIGGESTRPGSTPIPPSLELSRILPALRLAHALRGPHQAISVDTYHASVADAALRAGAHIINDVTAGAADPLMLPTVARHGAALVLMHMRGSPQTMMAPEHLDYGPDLVAAVGAELLQRLRAAERAGVRRWRILLDPGFGFAKTTAQNVELLRRFAELRAFPGLEGLPWVVGLSRKRFTKEMLAPLGNTGSASGELFEASNVGTHGALMAAIQGGADVVRVHDTLTTKALALVGDMMWR